MLDEEIVIEQRRPTEQYRAHFEDEPLPIGYGATPAEALFELLHTTEVQDRLQLKLQIKLDAPNMKSPTPQPDKPGNDTLFHVAVLSPLFMLMMMPMLIVLTYVDRPLLWWQVITSMVGLSVWDFGWHAAQHHPNFWPARWPYRTAGVMIGLAGLATSLFI